MRHILSQITQRYYLLVQLKNMAIEKSMLNQIFQSLIISRIRYAIEAISGNLNNSDIDMIDSVLRKAQRWGISSVAYSYRDIALEADLNLVKKMVNNPQHVLHTMVPEIKSNNRYELRNNNKSYKVDLIINSRLRNSFIYRNFCQDKH